MSVSKAFPFVILVFVMIYFFINSAVQALPVMPETNNIDNLESVLTQEITTFTARSFSLNSCSESVVSFSNCPQVKHSLIKNMKFKSGSQLKVVKYN